VMTIQTRTPATSAELTDLSEDRARKIGFTAEGGRISIPVVLRANASWVIIK